MTGNDRTSGPRGVLTMVCITCGHQEFFDRTVPNSLTCRKCGAKVFRHFATPTEPDEAAISHMQQEARSIAYGDSSPQTSPDEVRDLDAQ